jgi:hypothetical protein
MLSLLNLQHRFHSEDDDKINFKPKFNRRMTGFHKKRKPPALQARGNYQGMRQEAFMF